MEPVTAVTTALSIAKTAAEISKKLYQQNMAALMKPLASVQARFNERYFSRAGGEPVSAAQNGASQKTVAHN